MPLVINEDQAEANSRVTAIRAAILMSRSLEIWRRGRLDAESVAIILAVIAITSEKFIRKDLEDVHKSLEAYLPIEALQACNIASIAAATGMNRETVRRRVAALIQSGSLIRTADNSITLPPGKVQDRSAMDLVRRQLEALVRFANESLRDGVIEVRE